MIKSIIRVILKIPLTPVVVFTIVALILTSYIFQFADWLYDADCLDKQATTKVRRDFVLALRKWFTTA
jgi:hypothetical protein